MSLILVDGAILMGHLVVERQSYSEYHPHLCKFADVKFNACYTGLLIAFFEAVIPLWHENFARSKCHEVYGLIFFGIRTILNFDKVEAILF